MPRHYLAALLTLALAGLAAAAPAPERPQSQQEYWAQFDRHDWSAAIRAAEQLVASAREKASAEPLALAEALTLLGNAQLAAAEYASAEKSFNEALAVAERQSGAMGAALVEPLRGVGYTYALQGRHEEAVPVLERAVRVSHRNFGLFDLGQQEMLWQIANSLTKLRRATEAQQYLGYMRRVAERKYGAKDPQIVPTMCRIASWYSRTAQFPAAREMYREALEIVDKRLGKSSVAAVEPLRGLAETYTTELHYSTLGIRTQREQRVPTEADGTSSDAEALNPRYLSSSGEKALDRAVAILQAQSNPPQKLYVDTLVQAGDWRQVRGQYDKALELYRRAAAVLAAADTTPAEGLAQQTDAPQPLSFAVQLYYPKPWLATRYLTIPAEALDESFVEVEFTVTARGDTRDVRLLEHNGAERQANDTLEAIRAARYRPRFVNGEPVETTGLKHREVFRTRKAEQSQS